MRLNEKIQIVNHHPEWIYDYFEEVEMLRRKPALSTMAYEHIGSTSIPNIKAKPIIDIIIGVESFPPADDVVLELEQSGYTFMKEMSVADRFYFIKRGDKHFNVHVISYKGTIWNNDILFRNYLINHPDEAQKYSSLKEQIVSSGVETLLEYSEKKKDFILDIYEKIRRCYDSHLKEESNEANKKDSLCARSQS
ncbi:MAG: GrpB family protein [Acetatifactor sp.]|nr:GrpB family protein [Acetatifactor sp.]